jgi:hypothetical protein
MITDQEWDEMRTEAQLRLRLLRDEIRDYRRGNRAQALEGVANAARQRFEEDIPTDGEETFPLSAGAEQGGASQPRPPGATSGNPATNAIFNQGGI